MVLVAPLHCAALLALAQVGTLVAGHSSHCELALGTAHVAYGSLIMDDDHQHQISDAFKSMVVLLWS